MYCRNSSASEHTNAADFFITVVDPKQVSTNST